MGNQVCLPSKKKNGEQDEKPIYYPGAILGTENIFTKELNQAETNGSLLDELLHQTQQHNLELMKAELQSDINLFILNNLLMSVQFYDNFEKTISSAKSFKHEIENQIAEKLAPLSNDGVIHGERRCFLIHGMAHELAQNYIYEEKREKNLGRNKSNDASGENFNMALFRKREETQNCESIMPLEFIVTWDNLEIYKESDWDILKEYEYSAAKGTVATNRFCMEEPNSKTNISKGYIRLRCVDVPTSMKQTGKMLEPIEVEKEYDYSHFSDFNDNEGVDEVRTESDVTSDDDEFLTSGDAMLRGLESRLQVLSQSQPLKNSSKAASIQNEKFPLTMTKHIPGERRNSGVLPNSYQKHTKEITSRPSTSQIISGRPTEEKFIFDLESGNRNSNFLPSAKRNDFLRPQTMSTGNLAKSLPKLDVHGNLHQSASSGYESVSSAISRGSSLNSEDIREKWRKVEIKKLWQFPPKRRKSKEPLQENCFMEVQIPVDSDEEEMSESDSDESTDSSSSADKTTKRTSRESDTNNIRKLMEPKYEPRTYLNSVTFSSDFCSEFNQIGTQMGLTSVSLQNAIVVGTTIRCSVLHPAGLDDTSTNRKPEKDSFRFLYTFTPSIQSKCLPQKPLIWWRRKMLKNEKQDEEKWPQPYQVESIESMGTNIIPLGQRSINNTQYENVQQTLEWQVGYGPGENVLLNSLKAVHWRALLFTALLYRAFLAPLGPLGIGLEHFRNVIYQMCHQEFLSWNEEQPGIHLMSLIQRVYASLAQGAMQNFFIGDHNMLKNIPIQNNRIIQAQLKKVYDNILVYFMFAFRNMKPVRHDIYKMPNLLKLYKIITTRNEKDLISWVIMTNPFPGQSHFGSSQGTVRRSKKISKKKRRQQQRENNLKRSDGFDSEFGTFQQDKYRQKLIKKRLRWEKQQQNKEQEIKSEQDLMAEKQKLPDQKSSTFDLNTLPVKRLHYSSVRLSLLLKFFIEHFIQMAEKSKEFCAYSQAAMYVLHVENLCEILSSIRTESIDAQELKDKVQQIRDSMGVYQMREYIRSKTSKFNSIQETIDPLSSLSTAPINSYSSNIILGNRSSRELPEPPKLHEARARLDAPNVKKIATPNFMQSLRSLPATDMDLINNNIDPEVHTLPIAVPTQFPISSTLIPRVKNPALPKRIPSIKYIEKPSQRKTSVDSNSQGESTDL